MAGRRSAFAVYQQLQKEAPEEHAAEERVAETSVEYGCNTNSASAVTDASPEVSVVGKKRKASHRKEASKKKKKRKLLASAAKGDETDSENEKERRSDVKSSKLAKLKRRSKQSGRKAAKMAKRRTKKATSEALSVGSSSKEAGGCQMVDGPDELSGLHPVSDGDRSIPPSPSTSPSGLDLPFHSQFDPEEHEDSRVAAKELFRLLISPLSLEQFYSDIWEKKPLLLRRRKPHYNDGWFSSEELDCILHEHYVEYTTNIDITSYENGKRQTHNPTGRAQASEVWEFFKEGCSVRLLNPQSFSQSMWLLNSTLQEHFNSCVGANVYLTPAHSQGFAPHYDDIEAFVLQLEGKKHWWLYEPRNDSEVLPRFSSCNFSQDKIGEPILDVILEPGDLLYFPRGTIHQASTPPDAHSLHITVSTCQMNTWGDLLEKLVPAALQVAMSEDVDFRRALPLDYLDYMGVVNADTGDPRRKPFFEKITHFMSKLIQYAPIDGAADQMGEDHLYNCLPPCLTEKERQNGVWERGARWVCGEVRDHRTKLTGSTKVKLIRHGVVRLVLEEESPVLYHNLHNSRVYHEKDKQGMTINPEDAPAVEHLIQSYPSYVTVDSLPLEDASTEEKVELCHSLFSQGLLLVQS